MRAFIWPSRRGNGNLRIVQFNILADGLSAKRPDLGGFADVDLACLEWGARYPRIAGEILACDPDVICMQEVDHPESFTEDALFQDYDWVFKAKPNSPAIEFGGSPDGCLILYKKERLNLILTQSFHLGDQCNQVAACIVVEDLLYRDRRYVICCTHLKASKNKEGEAIRVKQVDVLSAKLHLLRSEHHTTCTFVCVDLNGTPDGDAYERCRLLGLKSGMQELMGKEPEFTTCKKRGDHMVRHTIDYIFYDPGSVAGVLSNVRPVKYLAIPETLGCLPSWTYPSDHVMLCVVFACDYMDCGEEQSVIIV